MTTWTGPEELKRNIQMLTEWSGLPEDWVAKAVARVPSHYYEREFERHAPASAEELAWWYRTSSYYLWHLANHAYWPELDDLDGPVLDFGGGLGNNFFTLLERGETIDYYDIGLACQDFVRWRLEELRGKGKTFTSGGYLCRELDDMRDWYNSIVMQDVLEHVPGYEGLLLTLTGKLRVGGRIYEETHFEDYGIGEHVHLRAARPLAETMAQLGMEPVREHVWRRMAMSERDEAKAYIENQLGLPVRPDGPCPECGGSGEVARCEIHQRYAKVRETAQGPLCECPTCHGTGGKPIHLIECEEGGDE